MLKRFYVLCCYSFLSFLSLFFAFQFYYDLIIPEHGQMVLLRAFLWMLPIKLGFLILFGQFTTLLAYFRLPDLNKILFATLCPTLAALSGKIFFKQYIPIPIEKLPIGIVLGDFFIFTAFLTGFRLLLRQIQSGYFSNWFKSNPRQHAVAILGAGEAGAAIAADLLVKKALKMNPVIFLDDDFKKHGKRIHEIPVVGYCEDIVKYKDVYTIEKAIIAIPYASKNKIKKLVQLCDSIGLTISILPYMSEFDAKFINANEMREPNLNDILDREPPTLDYKAIQSFIENQVVLVTGAGGSIGSELCAQILRHRPALLLAMDLSEASLFQVEQALIKKGYKANLVALLGDVKDVSQMHAIFKKYQPKIVFHAAAYKHVPIVEKQPIVGAQNNFLGTWNLASIAKQYQVKKFILISTDKAVNPTNIMGASKRLCELTIKAFQASDQHQTVFSAVRFGNVIGSSGSAIPIFNQQIKEGGPVTVTHPDIERYFMSIPEAVGLVLESATKSVGGEIFVLNMGNPLKIVDVARKLIELNGLRPDLDVPIVFTELRPGEKLYEEIYYHFEEKEVTGNPAIFKIIDRPENYPSFQSLEKAKQLIEAIDHQAQPKQILKDTIKALIPQYEEVPSQCE